MLKKLAWRSLKFLGIFFLTLFLLSFYSKYQLQDEDHPSIASDNQLSCVNPLIVAQDVEQLKQLEAEYSSNKIIPNQYKNSILIALSQYPELRNTHIEFVVRETFTPIESRPVISTIFGSKKKRKYQVIINPKVVMGMKVALFDSLSFDAKVGAIGHELGHTVYYQNKSTWGLIQVGLSYPWGEFRKRFERQSDMAAILHCLGDSLLIWSQELRPVERWQATGGYYLSPMEIESFIDK